MVEKVVRLLKLIQAVQARPGVGAGELAERLGVSTRTVFRDLELLSLVAPITNEGRGTGYRFLGKFALHPLDLTADEAVALQLAPSLVDDDQRPAGFATAIDKVLAAHRKQQAHQHNLIADIADLIQMGSPAYRPDTPNHLQTLITAILEHRTIDAEYHTQSRDATTVRRIDPYYLVPRDQRFYLIGYCHTACEVRTFRVSRFRSVGVGRGTFDKGDFSIQTYLKHTFSIEQGGKLLRFKVKFSPNVARYIKEEELFVRPRMTDVLDGGLLFEVTVNHAAEFLRWVLQYGAEAEVLEPADVRDQLRDQLDAWRAMYR
jgi:predicted DNA-binding transcriptional regulator YafY